MDFGFLFDNDGVLVDSRELHWKAWQVLMTEDTDFQMTFEQFLVNFGCRVEDFLDELFPEVSLEKKIFWDKRQYAIFKDFVEAEGINLIPGMEDFLQEAKKHGVPMIIASSASKQNLELFFRKSKLGLFFDQFICASDVTKGKPNPQVFQLAANKLHLDPHNCVAFEDALAGLQAAYSAGCTVVALETTQSKAELSYYDLIYPSPKQLVFEEILEFHHDRAQKKLKM